MVLTTRDPHGSNYQFVIRPNSSLSWRGAKMFFAAAGVASMGVATVLSLMGAWLVLPFAGIEMVGLAAAMYHCACRALRFEVVAIRGDDVEVTKGRRRVTQCWRFHRHWAQVRLDLPRHEWYASRLRIVSHGRSVELGGCLSEEERRELAGQLQSALKPWI